ncbi:signal peptidase I [Clostridium polynesiense]|uniref:signal peptidase I n=1 Tax=Clostridium polynesiense TaxID=1325933 RepID=UPI000693337F|nr:signal peptidase I [Clostridium polynesiense]
MKNKTEENSFIKQIVFDWIFPIIAAIIIAYLINTFLIFKVYIPSESMKPTLNEKDQLFVTKMYNRNKIERGDILVFYSHEIGDLLIKRVIGLPGDKVDIKNGEVSVNGEKLEESYVKYPAQSTKSFEVPEGKYLFLGDNRANSNDGRMWKNPYIDGKDIKGKAQVRVYPFNRIGFIK